MDAEDIAAVARFRERLAAGEEELVPAAMVARLIGGENPVKVWREHRGMAARALAEAAGLSQAHVSQIEGGKRDGSVRAMKAIADALGITIDDLV
ncbi:helix-turn-helix transcriptional regulator [Zavarzinia compransoris]|uniref:helix-turn-helix domain-containing protein n=1 Tax=Zavarzinia marina TaxID=2911065 RepID=UPI001F40C782|nr:helix-turn-helix transcriptional regulator [Zavarzinia marina]MCF4165969.1 helix-turn-helix transcriptional regulator [Zavarzinia marina]